jgi:H+-translocating NAD(P) transhydrogenase subunit beta
VIVDLAYLAAAVLFMLGLRMLSSVGTARRGNALSMTAMTLAVAATLVRAGAVTWAQIIAGVAVGAVIGAVAARRVPMTSMPQMVALFNGFGGGASLLVAAAELHRAGAGLAFAALVAAQLSALVGAATFTGSVVAFAKLQDLVSGRPVLFPGQHWLNLVLLAGAVALGAWVTITPEALGAFALLAAAALVLGVLFVIPIGGADMPVVIALLNSLSGIAVAATGFVLSNNLLIIVGALVGASGLILTRIMSRAMNRSLANVLFAGFGAAAPAASPGAGPAGGVTEGTVEDGATVLGNARSVIVVPGYGMAVAQAQHAIRELADLLAAGGATVRYAIHPVAGRMPGHMNVLLAEAQVPYDQLYDLDQINDEFPRTDVALVVGANDVVNPAARTNPASPIYGMPVLDAEQARTVIVLKRSMSPGFAGIENELFVRPNTMMVFGDARRTLERFVAAVKAERPELVAAR